MPQSLQPVRIQNFEGGLYLGEKTLAKDNQLTVLKNWSYNSDRKLQTRRGTRNFGAAIPDAVKVIHNCDTTASNGTWAASDDAVTLTVDNTTQKRGAGALKFNVTVATSGNNYATLTNSTLSAVDITTTKGSIGFWVFIPSGAKTNLTDCRLRVGSSAGNYYEFTLSPSDLTEGSFVFVKKSFSGATTTGTPNDTAINYLLFRVNYTGAYTDKVGFEIDDIVAYSTTSLKPMMSIKYFEESVSPFKRHLLTNVGTSFFEYDEPSGEWVVFKTGLTNNTRFSMTAYKNIMYLTNNTDNYFSYDGKTATDHTGANTYKALCVLLANDVGYVLNDPTTPSTLAYTGGTPASLQTFPNVLVLDEDGSDGKGTALINLGPVVIAGKERKIYKINVAAPSREQLDYSDGMAAVRGVVRVENEVFFNNKKGIYTLAQREATTGSLRTDPLTIDIQPLMDTITNHEICAGYYVPKLNNFYFFCDTTDDGIPDICLVFSILTKKWTQYTNINANEAVIYTDTNGVEYFLIANANTGQCKEIEYGFNDSGVEIPSILETKDFDFDIPETLKTFELVEIHGFIGETSQFDFNAVIDDDTTTATATILGSTYASGISSFTFASYAFGNAPYGGSGDSTTLYPFVARIPMNETGQRIRLKITVNDKNSVVIITKASIYPYSQPLDLFNVSYQY